MGSADGGTRTHTLNEYRHLKPACLPNSTTSAYARYIAASLHSSALHVVTYSSLLRTGLALHVSMYLAGHLR